MRIGPLADSNPALEGNYNGVSSHYLALLDGIANSSSLLRSPRAWYETPPQSDSDSRLGVSHCGREARHYCGLFQYPWTSPAHRRRRVSRPRLWPVGGGFFGGHRLPAGVRAGDFSACWTWKVNAHRATGRGPWRACLTKMDR